MMKTWLYQLCGELLKILENIRQTRNDSNEFEFIPFSWKQSTSYASLTLAQGRSWVYVMVDVHDAALSC